MTKSRPHRLALFGAISVIVAALATAPASAAGVQFTGVNLAGAEFNGGRLPGRANFDYVYPNAQEIAYFASKGVNVFRVPVLWERLQPTLNAPLDRAELKHLQDTVALMERSGTSVVIDIHGFGRYRGGVVGSAGVPLSAFADLWSRIAALYSADDKVIFGLMNEPAAMTPIQVRDAANAALTTIRGTGAKNLVLVPGAGWSGAHDFVAVSGAALSAVKDPVNRIAFEAHQYLDADNSGTHWTCRDPKAARATLVSMTAWLRAKHAPGFLGEFGVADNPQCLESLSALLDYMNANADVWQGWTYWAAGAWWGDYPMSVEPKGGVDRRQMSVLTRHSPGPKKLAQ